ncbi:MAG: hypothetical protein JST89_01170 [Cyanobacteria bacterium SZAS-4]|nr:hypothetical protein [Cyanobacteria bacterium SZAS-4]
MRLCTSMLFVCFTAAGLLVLAAYNWDLSRLEAEFDLRSGWNSYQMQERNFCTMTEDIANLMFDHPTLDRLRARVHVARALYSCENIGLAFWDEVDDLAAAIRLDPKYARAYLYRGCTMAHIRTSDATYRDASTKQMIEDFSTAIELDPHGSPTQLAYGYLSTEYLYQFNQPDRAIESCSLAISNLPTSEFRELRGQYWLRAKAYGKLGQREKAADDQQSVKRLDAEIEREQTGWTDRLDSLVWQSKKPTLILSILTLVWTIRRRRGTPITV